MAEPAPSPWRIERLSKQHDRRPFNCGVVALDQYLKTHANQDQKRSLSSTFVALDFQSERIWGYYTGYYTLSLRTIEFEVIPIELSKRLPQYPVPVIHMARLAVDVEARGKRLGEYLLMHSLAQALTISNIAGGQAMDLEAKEGAREF